MGSGRIETPGLSAWLIRAYLGDPSTPDGTRFRILVISTASVLPMTQLPALPQDATLHFEAIVTLTK